MSITILSPYRLFFIDEAGKLWTVLKDGRVRFIKNFESFQVIASDKKTLCGVQFHGEDTRVIQTDLTFEEPDATPLFTGKGYFYYPNLWVPKKQKLAIVKADLLNPQGTGDLIIYEKARTKFHPLVKIPAKIAPSVWNTGTRELFYLTHQNALAKTDGKTGHLVAEQASLFTLNPNGTEVAYYHQDCITMVSLQSGVHQRCLAFDVTALGYDATSPLLYFATYKGKGAIYQFDKRTGEVSLVLNHAHAVRLITS